MGYKKSASIAKKALASGKRIKDIIVEEKVLNEEQFETFINPYDMIKPKHMRKKAKI